MFKTMKGILSDGHFFPLLSYSINFSSGDIRIAVRVTIYVGLQWVVFQNLFLDFNFSVLHVVQNRP